MKRTICVDFDGVIHSYTSGWRGPCGIPDKPVPGAIEWLRELSASTEWEVAIYSSRSKEPGAVAAMKSWLIAHSPSGFDVECISFPTEKPAAYLTLDDRAICFQGSFPTQEEMDAFRPWYKRTHGVKP